MDAIRIESSPQGFRVFACLSDGPAPQERELPALWLRERVREPEALDPVTKQRLYNPHALPPDLRIVEARAQSGGLRLRFSDGYVGVFAEADLAEQAAPPPVTPPPRPWRTDSPLTLAVPWASLTEGRGMRAALELFFVQGFVIFTGTPQRTGSLSELASRFGCVRETNFGRLFDVYARSGSNDLAYRAVALFPHTDNPYRDPAPGIQFLHCLVNDNPSGETLLVDALAAGEALAAEDPEGFELLATVPLRFWWMDGETELVTEGPLILRTPQDRMTGVRYNTKLDRLPLMSPAATQAYQQARRRFAELLAAPQFELRTRLNGGDLLMLDNARVLHGRTAFDPALGTRHLQGCYIDIDGPAGKLRVLARAASR